VKALDTFNINFGGGICSCVSENCNFLPQL